MVTKSAQSADGLALSRIKAARKIVLSVVRADGDPSTRLAVVADGLTELLKTWPPSQRLSGEAPDQWLPLPPGPAPSAIETAANHLRGMLMRTIDAIAVTGISTAEGEFVRRGVWRDEAGSGLFTILCEFAERREANIPDAADLFGAGPNSIAAENAIGEIARELYAYLEANTAGSDERGI